MTEVWQEQVEAALNTIVLPHVERNLVDADALHSLALAGDELQVHLRLGFPAKSLVDELVAGVQQALAGIEGFSQVSVTVDWQIPANCANHPLESIAGVRNIIAIASGKGGVGKSTCAVNLALALVAEGARVGLLDADIYGPSQSLMLGIPDGQRPGQQGNEYLLPIVAHGVQSMSMGFLTTDKTPMVWRGPMVSGALQQMLNQTLWDNLDYLIVDMPPGTGDVQLTLSQRVPVSGAVIVTTPQDIALFDAVKGIEMFRKVDVPVLGVIENMAWHQCTQCGHHEHLFGEGGGEQLARDYDVKLLGSLPLKRSIREDVDAGTPTVAVNPTGAIGTIYCAMARQIAANLAAQATSGASGFPEIETADD
jgi:ATP-binding protein involved in chromosome partitioning